MKCDNCTEKCPQEELCREIAKGRKYATDEVIRLQKEMDALKSENAQLHSEAQAINATLDELEKEVRNKAIDEFLERIENHTFTEKTEEYSNSVSFMREIRKIAEELKGGAK